MSCGKPCNPKNVCAKHTVPELRKLVKEKQPNLAVSRMNKSQLLAFHNGSTRNAPVIPKGGKETMKVLKKKSLKAIADKKKAPPVPPALNKPPVHHKDIKKACPSRHGTDL